MIVAPTHSELCIAFDELDFTTNCSLSFTLSKRRQQQRQVPKKRIKSSAAFSLIYFFST